MLLREAFKNQVFIDMNKASKCILSMKLFLVLAFSSLSLMVDTDVHVGVFCLCVRMIIIPYGPFSNARRRILRSQPVMTLNLKAEQKVLRSILIKECRIISLALKYCLYARESTRTRRWNHLVFTCSSAHFLSYVLFIFK